MSSPRRSHNGSPASPVEVRTIPDPENPDGLLVLCRSALRREKELAMISQAEQRFKKDTAALRQRIAKGRLKDAGKIERAIGRLQMKHPRVARFDTLRHESGKLGALVATRDDEKFGQAGQLCGNYVLHIRKATVPDAEQSQVYRLQGIDWKSEYPTRKTFIKSGRFCSAFRGKPPVLWGIHASRKKLGLTPVGGEVS